MSNNLDFILNDTSNVLDLKTKLNQEPYLYLVCLRLRWLSEYMEMNDYKVSEALIQLHLDNLRLTYGPVLYAEGLNLTLFGKVS